MATFSHDCVLPLHEKTTDLQPKPWLGQLFFPVSVLVVRTHHLVPAPDSYGFLHFVFWLRVGHGACFSFQLNSSPFFIFSSSTPFSICSETCFAFFRLPLLKNGRTVVFPKEKSRFLFPGNLAPSVGVFVAMGKCRSPLFFTQVPRAQRAAFLSGPLCSCTRPGFFRA